MHSNEQKPLTAAQQIEAAVTELLSTAGVTYSVQFIAPTKRDDWECDEWRVSLKSPNGDYTFPFFTGIGHRKMHRSAEAFRNGARPGTIAYANWKKAFSKPQAPHAANVLHSVVLDGRAIDESFCDWCDEYGYDTDSRKALQTYKACCECGRKLRKLFTHEQRAKLEELLQDY